MPSRGSMRSPRKEAASARKKRHQELAAERRLHKERAASAYDAAKASGIPEYRVYVTPTGTENWTPIGCVTVPRTESVSQSIFGNEESLLQVARQAGVKGDLENDDEIAKVSFCASLLDTFDDLGREFILAHGQVDFV